jgi:hypothetical protein
MASPPTRAVANRLHLQAIPRFGLELAAETVVGQCVPGTRRLPRSQRLSMLGSSPIRRATSTGFQALAQSDLAHAHRELERFGVKHVGWVRPLGGSPGRGFARLPPERSCTLRTGWKLARVRRRTAVTVTAPRRRDARRPNSTMEAYAVPVSSELTVPVSSAAPARPVACWYQ